LSGWEEKQYCYYVIGVPIIVGTTAVGADADIPVVVAAPAVVSDLVVSADNDITTVPMQHSGPLFSVTKAISQGFEKTV
jgi:hypothetical protein